MIRRPPRSTRTDTLFPYTTPFRSKVLGASVASIITMLSNDFVKLVCLAIVIASPLAWWAMNKWLEDFAYRTDIQWWMFAVAGLTALVIALFTVGWKGVRAAVANPVESLRDE